MKKHLYQFITIGLALIFALMSIACGGSGGKGATGVASVTSVTLTPSTANIYKGQTQLLTATVLPDNAANKGVSWSTSDASIATVTDGLVTAVAGGRAAITVTTDDGGKTADCAVTVIVSVTGVTLTPAISIPLGEARTLTANIAPSDATNTSLVWTSSDTNIATVSNGTVTGVSTGSSRITVRTIDGNFTAACDATVYVPAAGVTVSPTTASIPTGLTQQLSATIAPSNATYKNITWTSSNQSIATVSASGLVTGVLPGDATITAATQEGNHTANCYVTVTYVAVAGVAIYPASAALRAGRTRQLTAQLSPGNATNKNVTWSSDNPGIATVSETGLLTTITQGGATITVKTQEGGYTGFCYVTVSDDILDPDVYVSGQVGMSVTGSWQPRVAAYWKNGERAILLNDDQIQSGTYSAGYSIFVDDIGDVYVAGYRDDFEGYWQAPILWKNDAAQILYPSEALRRHYAYSVFVSEGHVCVAATVEDYWNGVRIPLVFIDGTGWVLNSGGGDAEATGVFISDSTVYVSGTDYIGSSAYAVCWEGGARIARSGDIPASGGAVFVSGQNVYIGGTSRDAANVQRATVWKNGDVFAVYPIPSGFNYGYVKSVYVDDAGNVYAAGDCASDNAGIPMVWKNDQVLYALTSQGSYGAANSVYVYNGDVYVAGAELVDGIWKATLWINGDATRLTEGNSSNNIDMAYSVFVKSR